MATAGDLATACVRGWAEERLSDVAGRLRLSGGHYCAVFEKAGEKFLGLIRMIDVAGYNNPGNRLLIDLLPTVESLRVRSDEPADSTAEIFEKYGLSEAVIVDPAGAFVGIVTAESVLGWTVRELKRRNAELALWATKQPERKTPRVAATPMALPVLVVEDHEASRRALVRILTSRGVRSVSVGSMADAFKAVQSQRFAAVLSDIGLPDGNGYELMSALQAQYNLPCVSMTASDEIADPRGINRVQLLAHLTKPLHIRQIDTVIESLKSRLKLSATAGVSVSRQIIEVAPPRAEQGAEFAQAGRATG